MAFYMRSAVSGLLRTILVYDVAGRKVGARHFVKALERGRQSIDGRSVEVQPGVVVSFADERAPPTSSTP
jgi:hypothetical protein